MIHPHTELRHISPEIGYGIFATQLIPKGTIVYVKDALEVEVDPASFSQHPPHLQEVIEKYSYIDERGVRVLSWDLAKYVNHCCNCNTISTGYGFEIALRDIHPGEEITDEYGIFNLERPLALNCDSPHCRKIVTPDDIDHFYPQWDEKILDAMSFFTSVDQPLFPWLESGDRAALQAFLLDPSTYQSVRRLKYHATNRMPAE